MDAEEQSGRPHSATRTRRLYGSLERWLKEYSPRTYSELQNPVSPDDLGALETALGRRLPDDLRAALQTHDGQPCLDGYSLIPAERILERYQDGMRRVEQASPIPGGGTCRPVVWSKGWIPFAEDGGLNFLCIDLDPGPEGTTGQVIHWVRRSLSADTARPSLYADAWKSFDDWLGSIVEACLAGEVDIDAEGFVFLK